MPHWRHQRVDPVGIDVSNGRCRRDREGRVEGGSGKEKWERGMGEQWYLGILWM